MPTDKHFSSDSDYGGGEDDDGDCDGHGDDGGDSLLIAAKKLLKAKSFNISFEETKRRGKVIEKAINFTIPCYLYSCQRLADILMKGLYGRRSTCQAAQPTNRFSDWKSVVNCHHTLNTVIIFLKALSKMQQTQVIILTL